MTSTSECFLIHYVYGLGSDNRKWKVTVSDNGISSDHIFAICVFVGF